MIIQFVNRQSKLATKAWQALIRRVFANALPPGTFTGETAVTVTFAGPIVMRRINRETRDVDRLTDVLSFPLLSMQEGRLSVPLGAQDYDQTVRGEKFLPLGDIVIAPDVARQQARQYGHSTEREMAFLAVHGLLHLLGFDHDTPEREKKMTALQEEILQPLGLTRPHDSSPDER